MHLGDGQSLPMPNSAWMDVVFVAGTIIALKLGTIQRYADEFARVLRSGGMLVFDYLDPTTDDGWAHLHTEGRRLADVYTYHAPEVIDRVFAEAGFEQFERQQVRRARTSPHGGLRRVTNPVDRTSRWPAAPASATSAW